MFFETLVWRCFIFFWRHERFPLESSFWKTRSLRLMMLRWVFLGEVFQNRVCKFCLSLPFFKDPFLLVLFVFLIFAMSFRLQVEDRWRWIQTPIKIRRKIGHSDEKKVDSSEGITIVDLIETVPVVDGVVVSDDMSGCVARHPTPRWCVVP